MDCASLKWNAPHSEYVPQLGRGRGKKAIFLLVMDKAEACQVGGTLAVDRRGDGHVVLSENDVLGLRDPFFEKRWRDGALVDIEEGYVVVGGLMKKDDEFDEVGVRLLPEGLLSTSEKVVQERGDVVREGVGVEVVVERVVAVLGIETDFDVILGPMVPLKDVFYFAAKIAFDFQNQPTDSLLFVGGFVGQNLLRERKHAAGCFATANSAQDGNSGEQTALGDREPIGSLGRYRFARVVYLADDKKEVIPLTGIGILGKASGRDGLAGFQSKDVEARKHGRADEVWSGEQERAIEIFEAQEYLRSTHGNDTEKNLIVGERVRVEKERTDGHDEDGRDEDARFEGSFHQALARASMGWVLSGPGWPVRRASR